MFSHRSEAKGRTYICGPLDEAPDDDFHRAKKRNGKEESVVGQSYRSAATALPRRFLGLDIDYMRDADTMTALHRYMECLSAFGYTTFSHKPDAPRMRWIVEIDREADRDDCIAASAALRYRIVEAIGAEHFTKPDGGDGFDSSLDRPEQPIYTPGVDAETFVCNGSPLSLDELLSEAPAKPRGELVPAQAIPVDEEVVQRAMQDPSTGDSFAALWSSDISAYESHSHADMALMGMLWNACGDPGKTLAMFESSPLYRPDKVKKSRDVYAKTLAKVMQAPAKVTRIELEAADPCTDKANAIRIAMHLGDQLRYMGGVGWALFDGNRWDVGKQPGLPALGLVTQTLDHIVRNDAVALARREQMNNVPEKQQRAGKLFAYAKHSGDLTGIIRAMKLAEPRLFVPADAFDSDPLLLGCSNGVIDLSTGELLPSRPEQFITQSTGIMFDPKATAPTWDAFLTRIFRQHDDLAAFMQVMAGYWLTGLTDPAILAVLYGVGANGKSTFVESLQNAMGDYATVAPQKLLMARYGSEHSTEVMHLRGRRFVTAVESAEGGRLDEERVKALTGSL